MKDSLPLAATSNENVRVEYFCAGPGGPLKRYRASEWAYFTGKDLTLLPLKTLSTGYVSTKAPETITHSDSRGANVAGTDVAAEAEAGSGEAELSEASGISAGTDAVEPAAAAVQLVSIGDRVESQIRLEMPRGTMASSEVEVKLSGPLAFDAAGKIAVYDSGGVVRNFFGTGGDATIASNLQSVNLGKLSFTVADSEVVGGTGVMILTFSTYVLDNVLAQNGTTCGIEVILNYNGGLASQRQAASILIMTPSIQTPVFAVTNLNGGGGGGSGDSEDRALSEPGFPLKGDAGDVIEFEYTIVANAGAALQGLVITFAGNRSGWLGFADEASLKTTAALPPLVIIKDNGRIVELQFEAQPAGETLTVTHYATLTDDVRPLHDLLLTGEVTFGTARKMPSRSQSTSNSRVLETRGFDLSGLIGSGDAWTTPKINSSAEYLHGAPGHITIGESLTVVLQLPLPEGTVGAVTAAFAMTSTATITDAGEVLNCEEELEKREGSSTCLNGGTCRFVRENCGDIEGGFTKPVCDCNTAKGEEEQGSTCFWGPLCQSKVDDCPSGTRSCQLIRQIKNANRDPKTLVCETDEWPDKLCTGGAPPAIALTKGRVGLPPDSNVDVSNGVFTIAAISSSSGQNRKRLSRRAAAAAPPIILGPGSRVDFAADTVVNRADNQEWPNTKDVLYFELTVSINEDAANAANGDTATLSGAAVLGGETVEFDPMVFTVVEPELEPVVTMRGFSGSSILPWSTTNETVDSAFEDYLLVEATVNVVHTNTSLAPAASVGLTVDFNTSAAAGISSLDVHSTTLLDSNGNALPLGTTLADAKVPGDSNGLAVNGSWGSTTYLLVNISDLADRDTVCTRAASQWSQPTPGPTVTPKDYAGGGVSYCYQYLSGFGSEFEAKEKDPIVAIVAGTLAGVMILGLAIAGVVVRRRSSRLSGGLQIDMDDATIAKMDRFAVTGRPISSFQLDSGKLASRRTSAAAGPGARPLSKIAGSVHRDRKASKTSATTEWSEGEEEDGDAAAGEENPYGQHGQLTAPRSPRVSADKSRDENLYGKGQLAVPEENPYGRHGQLSAPASRRGSLETDVVLVVSEDDNDDSDGDEDPYDNHRGKGADQEDDYENAIKLLGNVGSSRAGITSAGSRARSDSEEPTYGLNGSLLYGVDEPAEENAILPDSPHVYRLSDPPGSVVAAATTGGEADEWAPMTSLFVARASQRVKTRSRHRSSAAAMTSMPGMLGLHAAGGDHNGPSDGLNDDDDDDDFGGALLQLMDHGMNRPRAGSAADVVLSGDQLADLQTAAAAAAAGSTAGRGSAAAGQLSFDSIDVLGFRMAMPRGFGSGDRGSDTRQSSSYKGALATDDLDGGYIVAEDADSDDDVSRGVFTPVLQEASDGGDDLNQTFDNARHPTSPTHSDFINFADTHDTIESTRRASVVDLV